MTKIILPETKPAFPALSFHDGEKCGELMEGKRRDGEKGRARVGAGNFFFTIWTWCGRAEAERRR